MTTEKKVTTPRAPRTKKVVSAPVTAVEAVQEVVAEQPVKVIPDAVKAAPNVVAGSIPLVATLNCQVCKQAKEKKTFVVQSKKAGFDTPEEGVMCKDCHEDLVAEQTKNGGKAGHYKNLLDSRNWDKHAYKTAKKIKDEAGRAETRLRCIGSDKGSCGLYHGQLYKEKVQLLTMYFFDKNDKDQNKDGDYEPIEILAACDTHKEVFMQNLRAIAPEKTVKFVYGVVSLSNFDLIQGINCYRKNKKENLEKEKEVQRLQTLAGQEAYRLKLKSGLSQYHEVPSNRPATKRQNDRHSLEGKFNSKEHDENEDRRHR